MSVSHLKFLESRLNKLKIEDRYRYISDFKVSPEFDFSSNDYLALGHKTNTSLLEKSSRLGSGAARLLINGSDYHIALETDLANFVGTQKALLFGSGYLANIGVISSIVQRNDIVVSDKLIHGSLIDGINLSRAKHTRAKHNSIEDFEKILKKLSLSRKINQNIFIVTESVFSMDGDFAPLRELYELSERFETFLVVDEAHAFGVFGESGEGFSSNLIEKKEHVIILGTLSKSFGSFGGFVCCSEIVREVIINFARTFLFSTALPDFCCLKATASLEEIINGSSLRKELFLKINKIKELLKSYEIKNVSDSQIVPILVGSSEKAVFYSNILKEQGIKVPAIRPPTVPPDKSRLRISLTNHHTLESLEFLVKNLAQALRS
jgi:8-amino-7-oxononanoate synthase